MRQDGFRAYGKIQPANALNMGASQVWEADRGDFGSKTEL